MQLSKINYLIDKYSKKIREDLRVNIWLIMNIDIYWNKEDFYHQKNN